MGKIPEVKETVLATPKYRLDLRALAPVRAWLVKLLPHFIRHPFAFAAAVFIVLYTSNRLLMVVAGDEAVFLPDTSWRWMVFLIQLLTMLVVFKLLSVAFSVAKNSTDAKVLEGVRRTNEIQKISIMGFARISEVRDQSTGNHITRMGYHARVIAEELGRNPEYNKYITKQYAEDVLLSAPLHDIGKVGIADNILKKAGSLTMTEFEMMKMHTIIGGDLMAELERKLPFKSFYTLGKEIAYHHHQKWDGTGYPNVLAVGGTTAFFVQDGVGKPLAGKDIPLSARIVAVADVYDALVSRRCYKEPLTHEVAKRMILDDMGTHFDPEVVRAFIRAEDRILEIAEQFKD
jgi:response regulator RpfG family c-di-GMP phosphodiesterase